VQIYHNPRCSKSRETLALLNDRGQEPEIIEYLKTPPTEAELDQICQKLNLEPQNLIRHKESIFAELGLSLKDKHSRQEWIKIIIQNPILLERPIVVSGERAAIGRPPENVLALL
jgi:arsenate reductase (glutaredoxin)